MRRRKYLTAFGVVGSIGLSGCLGGNDERDDDEGDNVDDNDRTNGEDRLDSGPEEVVHSFIEAGANEDMEVVSNVAHPESPLHPDAIEEAGGDPTVTIDVPELTGLETQIRMENATVDELLGIGLAAEVFDDDELAAIIDSEEATVVETTTEDEEVHEWIVVTKDGKWTVLWFTRFAESEIGEELTIDYPIVTDVSFDSDSHQGMVAFVDEPPIDEITVTSTNAGDETVIEEPEMVEETIVDLLRDGDQVVVSATVGNETAEIHRERYPSDERLVDEISFEPDEGNARVEFTGSVSGDELTVESTVYGGESWTDAVAETQFLAVGIEPAGDEVLVTIVEDNDARIVHRERHFPE